MVFPISIGGSVKLRNRPNAATLVAATATQIETLLENARATDWSVNGTTIDFTVSILRPVWNWNILVPINSGRFEIEALNDRVVVRYRLSTLRMLIMVSAMVGGVVLVTSVGQPDVFSAIMLGWPIYLGAWAWLFGMNYVISAIRIPFWLARGLKLVR